MSESNVGSLIAGYVSVVVSVILFGSVWAVPKIPRKFPLSDGIFYQWTMCVGIFLTGVFTMLIRGSIQGGPIYLEPFAMIGGALWTTGNLLCVPVLQMIGISLGPAIWGIGNMVTGWVTGTFGLFGLHSDMDDLNIFWLNCVGALLAALSVPCYALMKPKNAENKNDQDSEFGTRHKGSNVYDLKYNDLDSDNSENEEMDKTHTLNEKLTNESMMEEPLMTKDNKPNTLVSIMNETSSQSIKEHPQEESPLIIFISKLPATIQKFLGFFLAIIAGTFFGSNFDPPKYLQDNGLSSPNGIDYVLSHFLGIFVASTIYVMCYIIMFRNKPIVHKESIMPGFIAGIMWGIAQVCWFIANSNLPYVVSYPLITTGPGLVSALWGIAVFKEIKGWLNFSYFGFGTLVLMAGIVCIVVSY
ncbi:Transmembrane protein [Entamoeba marina]